MTSPQRTNAPGEPWVTITICVASAIVGSCLLFVASIVLFLVVQPCPTDVPCTELIDPLVPMALMWGAPVVLGLAGMITGVILIVRRRRGWIWTASLVGAGTLCWIAGLVLSIISLS